MSYPCPFDFADTRTVLHIPRFKVILYYADPILSPETLQFHRKLSGSLARLRTFVLNIGQQSDIPVDLPDTSDKFFGTSDAPKISLAFISRDNPTGSLLGMNILLALRVSKGNTFVIPELLAHSAASSTTSFATTSISNASTTGVITIPLSSYSSTPYPTPTLNPRPPIYPATDPLNPPSVSSDPQVVPDFAPAWSAAYQKAKNLISDYTIKEKVASTQVIFEFTNFTCPEGILMYRQLTLSVMCLCVIPWFEFSAFPITPSHHHLAPGHLVRAPFLALQQLSASPSDGIHYASSFPNAAAGHCDTVYAVEGLHSGQEDLSVFYIPAVLLSVKKITTSEEFNACAVGVGVGVGEPCYMPWCVALAPLAPGAILEPHFGAGEEELSDAMCIKWCKARVLCTNWWFEEVELLREEMRRVLAFFD
ncbi:hypothetical protein EV424DRAFT_1349544 [Suillus variegatus]|nr:hypothetical protein EV424DRAFT_1349544 [Suillus variegatus]